MQSTGLKPDPAYDGINSFRLSKIVARSLPLKRDRSGSFAERNFDYIVELHGQTTCLPAGRQRRARPDELTSTSLAFQINFILIQIFYIQIHKSLKPEMLFRSYAAH